MVDITHKNNTLRIAIASAIVRVSDIATIEAVQQRKVPKGDVFEFARAAGLLAVKKTSDVIPDCHPLPVEYTAITYDIEGMDIHIYVEVHTIYKTGVEVEAMHGASIVALTMYDMLKPIDKGIEIASIRLESKKGGKSDIDRSAAAGISAAIIVCSDSIANGTAEDSSGRAIINRLEHIGISTTVYDTIPDDYAVIQQKTKELAGKVNLVLFTGGTGLSDRDNTPDAVRPLLDKEIPGIMEQARRYGQDRMPFAMLSRGVAGFIGDTLVITLPGSLKGVDETMDAIFPQVLHLFRVKKGAKH
ncbi:MAG: bifunctional molybdenum cofactor biosynthesis protein MoaC/MoaB [Chitinophagaceae bacterium]|nr:MAG: bifunctional molybdenum cofactor biosynthesis protein MoaC/MoaB [Chitinophagaceae bacterium]